MVYITIARRYPRISRVLGKQWQNAARSLRHDGYKVEKHVVNTTTHPDIRVALQRPEAGTEALPGRVVTLTVWNNQCTPGYSPCLKPPTTTAPAG